MSWNRDLLHKLSKLVEVMKKPKAWKLKTANAGMLLGQNQKLVGCSMEFQALVAAERDLMIVSASGTISSTFDISNNCKVKAAVKVQRKT